MKTNGVDAGGSQLAAECYERVASRKGAVGRRNAASAGKRAHPRSSEDLEGATEGRGGSSWRNANAP